MYCLIFVLVLDHHALVLVLVPLTASCFSLWNNCTITLLRGGSAVGHWTCDLQVAGSIPGRGLSRNIGQLSLASLRGH